MEWLFFNAAQGARHPNAHSIAYLKTDNSYFMAGKYHPDEPEHADYVQSRYKYSPSHQDMAVCCVPNAGRIFPYYVRSMWLRDSDGLTAALYGPNDLQTTFNGVPVRILTETRYPFEYTITLCIEPEEVVEFALTLRRPAWASQMAVDAGTAEVIENPGALQVRKRWQPGDRVKIEFTTQIQLNQALNGEYYLSYGPLVYALPIQAVGQVTKEHPIPGFYDMQYLPETDTPFGLQLALDRVDRFYFQRQSGSEEAPWGGELSICGELYDPDEKIYIETRLVPMGGTILRKATFRAVDRNSDSSTAASMLAE
jgi:hypothetical protein